MQIKRFFFIIPASNTTFESMHFNLNAKIDLRERMEEVGVELKDRSA